MVSVVGQVVTGGIPGVNVGCRYATVDRRL